MADHAISKCPNFYQITTMLHPPEENMNKKEFF